MGGKAWKEEEEEKGCWQEGVAGAGPQEHLSGNRPRGGTGGREGTSGPGTRISSAIPALPHRGTWGCPALPRARLEVFQSRSPALEAFKDSLPMHRPGHGSPLSATPGAPVPNQTPTQNAKPNPGRALMFPAHPPTPTNSHSIFQLYIPG